MADENNIGATGAPAAEPQNTGQEHMIPKSRFDEVNNAYKAMREQVEELQRKQQADEAARLEQQQEWQKLAEQRKTELEATLPYKERAEAAQEVMQRLLNAQLEQLPTEAREMVNTMPGDVQQKLDWLAANQQRLLRPSAPNLDAGARGDAPPAKVGPMSAEEKRAWQASGLTLEKWNAYKARSAQSEPVSDVPNNAQSLIEQLRSRNQQ